VQALRVLDAKLELMSGRANATLWTEEAVIDAPEWAEVRTLARDVMRAFSWDAA